MPKIIVIDWDSQQVRLLECEPRGNRIQVQRLATLTAPDEHEAGASDAAREAVIRELAGMAKSGARVLGLVGRTQAVLRDLRVPTCPPAELPAIVRLQAMRELTFHAEQAAIDYELIGTPTAEGQQRVILAALQPDVVARFTRLAAESKLTVSRLGLRPYATWQAYTRVSGTPAAAVLVVSLAGESLELTVARGASVLFSRGTLLRGPSDGPAAAFDPAAAIVSEVRRTLAAFASQMPGTAVECVAFAARPGEHTELIRALATGLTVRVESFDPFQAVELAPDLAKQSGGPAPSAGAFVAAIGSALAAADGWPIDFLNPKRSAPPRDPRKPRAMLAAAAALLVLASGYLVGHYQIARGSSQIEALVERQNGLKEKIKDAEDVRQRYQAVEEWRHAETDCLRELRRLTEEHPDTRTMYLTELTITRDSSLNGTTRIALGGMARGSEPITEFHTKLNTGDSYSAQPKGPVKATTRSGEYRYSFRSQLAVKPPDGDEATDSADAELAGRTAARPKGARSAGTTRDANVLPAGARATGQPARKPNKKAE